MSADLPELIDRRRLASEVGLSPCVYFVEAHGLVKIGMTIDLAPRMAELQRVIPCPMRLVGVLCVEDKRAARALELQLHDAFCEYRSHGEWFALPDGWLDLVRERRVPLREGMAVRGGAVMVPLTFLYNVRGRGGDEPGMWGRRAA